MSKLANTVLFAAAVAVGCSSPAKVEVRPNPLVLEGKDARGKLEAVVFDEDGKQLTEGNPVTWMCLDSKTIKVQQDGTVIAQSSGKALVDVEIVGTDIHAAGTVEVKIPSWVETSVEELHFTAGQPPAKAWAEVRNDNGFPMKGYLPSWKVDDAKVVSISAMQDANETRSHLTITPLAAGETYITASYKDFARDIRVAVTAPAPAPPAE